MNKDGTWRKVITHEGQKPVLELIEILQNQKPLPALKLDEAIKQYSCEFVKDQGPTGKTGPKDSSGKDFKERVSKEVEK